MSKKASPAAIGAFVIGAVALAVVGVTLFGSGQLFRNTTEFVLFFPGTVDGLAKGAPVKFKGVEIGTVTDIRIRVEGMKEPPRPQPGADLKLVAASVRIPVFVEIDNDRVRELGGSTSELHDGTVVRELVSYGMRAQLASQSLVTGLLFVQLDFHPDDPPTFILPEGSTPPEIPTIPTNLEQIQTAAAQVIKKLEGMDVDQVIKAAINALTGIDRLANAPGIHESVAALPQTVRSLQEAAVGLKGFLGNLDQRTAPVLEALAKTVETTRVALEQTRNTFQSIEKTVAPNSAIAASLQTAMKDLSDAARAVRLLADYLERNPSALVRGRGEVSQ
ncbi:MAG: MlaD family protein [Candidatus Binatia bacterium]